MSSYQHEKATLASRIFEAIISPAVKQRVYSIICHLTQDRWLSNDLRNYSSASTQAQSQWFDILSFLNWYAHDFQPKNYLEVGVRRGRSMAQVLVNSPETEAYGFDMWIPGYAAEDNPGPEFAIAEMEKLGARKPPTLIVGNSHETLPSFFSNPDNPQEFDLINIDGDHSYAGAKMDLDIAFAHLAPGGVLVFDDISHHAHPELTTLWDEYKEKYPEYLFVDDSYRTGTGVAFKPPFTKIINQFESLPIHFFTIVLNGKPFIDYHIDVLKNLPFKWHWHIVEGVASLTHDTSWCLRFGGEITEELHRNGRSKDGTSEYLDEIAAQYPENITVYRKAPGEFWDGKREMVNAPLENIGEECLLWQVDVDEIWTLEQLCKTRQLFMNSPEKTAAFYWCWYFVGEELLISTRNCYAQNPQQEWLRTWRFQPGYTWATHSPPVLVEQMPDGQLKNIAAVNPLTHEETEKEGLVFQHFAYVTSEQLQFKQQYYGYQNAVSQWQSLQEETNFPAYLREYFGWVGDNTMVDRAERLGIVPIARKNDTGEGWSFLEQQYLQQLGKVGRRSPIILVDGVFFQLYNTGIARVWRSVLAEWAKTDFANHILLLDRVNTARIPGIRYRALPAYSYDNVVADKHVLQRICDEEKADLFISTYYTTPISTPSAFMAYDMIPEILEADLNQRMWREKHHAIRHADSYISISENTARDLVKFFPDIELDEVTVAHCGVASDFTPASADEIASFKYKYGISKPYFLLVGAGGNYKNASLFFQAFAQLHSKQGFAIVCTGSGITLADEYRGYAAGTVVHSLTLDDAELKAAYSGAIVLIYPSLYEGFGMPVAEALACGCPVITCANASIPEVGGDAVIYVDPKDIDGLAEQLCEVQKPKIRQLLIAKGLEQVKKFSWEKMATIMASALMEATLNHLKLREINFIVAPDWLQSEEVVGAQLQGMLQVLLTHPERSKITVLIDSSDTTPEDADLLLSSVVMDLLMADNVEVEEGPELVLMAELSPPQWDALRPHLKGRIQLQSENPTTVDKLSTVDVVQLVDLQVHQLAT